MRQYILIEVLIPCIINGELHEAGFVLVPVI